MQISTLNLQSNFFKSHFVAQLQELEITKCDTRHRSRHMYLKVEIVTEMKYQMNGKTSNVLINKEIRIKNTKQLGKQTI